MQQNHAAATNHSLTVKHLIFTDLYFTSILHCV